MGEVDFRGGREVRYKGMVDEGRELQQLFGSIDRQKIRHYGQFNLGQTSKK